MAMRVDWPTLKEMLGQPDGEALEIAGIEETADERRLGRIGIHRERAAFRYGYSFDFGPGTSFCKERFDFEDIAKRGWAVIFRRRFTPAGRGPAEEEFLAGWALDGHDAGLDAWIAEMNAHLADILERSGRTK